VRPASYSCIFGLLLLLLLCASLSTGCHPSGTTAPDPADSPSTDPAALLSESLPAPSTLKRPQGVVSDVFHMGSEFMDSWPWQRVKAAIGEHAIFDPEYPSESVFNWPAFGIYYFDATGFDHASTITVNWATSTANGDAWVGLADFEADRWCWHLLSEDGIAHFDPAACLDGGVAYAIVLLTGTIRQTLESVHLGFDLPPMIMGVSPISGETGAEAVLSTALNIPEDQVGSWHWDFGAGAVPGTSDLASPAVTLGAPGVYQCQVRAVNAWGESELDFLLAVNPAGSAWQIEGVNSVGEYSGATSLALEPTGDQLPHIVYADYGADHRVGHSCYGGAWIHEEVPATSDNEITHASLAMDGAGNLYLASCGFVFASCLFTCYGEWVYDGGPDDDFGDTDALFHAPYMVLDVADQPHISYELEEHAAGHTEQLICYSARSDEGWPERSWVAQQSNSSDELYFEGLNPLALNAEGLPRIAYHDNRAPGVVTFLELDGGGEWHDYEVETGVNVEAMDLVISDIDDTPLICYIVYAGLLSGHIHLAYHDGSNWQVATLDVTVDPSGWLSLAQDSNGLPHLCYYDQLLGELHYGMSDGADWYFELVDGEGTVGEGCDIALDSADRPHISYYDRTKGCIKYAYRPGS